MISKPLPTGDETPQGFEDFYEDMRRDSAGGKQSRVSRVSATQLSRSEVSELERLRKRSLEALEQRLEARLEGHQIDNRGFELTFEREMNLWPEDKTPTDKLVFREFSDDGLRGYALVVRGWPSAMSWTIQHLIIDPNHRLKGIGAKIVQSIELDALQSTESTTNLFAVPIASSGDSFWEFNGFKASGTRDVSFKNKEYSINVYAKKIR